MPNSRVARAATHEPAADFAVARRAARNFMAESLGARRTTHHFAS